MSRYYKKPEWIALHTVELSCSQGKIIWGDTTKKQLDVKRLQTWILKGIANIWSKSWIKWFD